MGSSTPTKLNKGKRKRCDFEPDPSTKNQASTLQIVTGSYEHVLHGFTASIVPRNMKDDVVEFKDKFLVNAHTSAIRCLGLSPPAGSKRILASGSTDERIKIYQLSTNDSDAILSESANSIKPAAPEKPVFSRNKELGSLIHHSAPITALSFSSRSNLISTASDNSIAITRTKDWTMLQMLKAPIGKPVGRPSGDTAGPGEIPAGINSIAIHPSAKVMLTVGKGERCMRSWDLVRGKKAEVLSFDKHLLTLLGEGRGIGSGEGRKICWDHAGEEYIVGFERGAAVFGLDSQVRGIIRPEPSTKIHQIRYIPSGDKSRKILALSTEDGRILFYCTKLTAQSSLNLPSPPTTPAGEIFKSDVPFYLAIAQLGGKTATLSSSRIKDFVVLPPVAGQTSSFVITASSDGATRIWSLDVLELSQSDFSGSSNHALKNSKYLEPGILKDIHDNVAITDTENQRRVGNLLGTYETGNRITCMVAFVMESQKPVSESLDSSSVHHD